MTDAYRFIDLTIDWSNVNSLYIVDVKKLVRLEGGLAFEEDLQRVEERLSFLS